MLARRTSPRKELFGSNPQVLRFSEKTSPGGFRFATYVGGKSRDRTLRLPDDSILPNDFRDTRNDAACTEIVRRHLPLVFHVVLRRPGTAALAEEAAQNRNFFRFRGGKLTVNARVLEFSRKTVEN